MNVARLSMAGSPAQFRTFRRGTDHSYARWTALGSPRHKAVTGDSAISWLDPADAIVRKFK
jgi:hypothetical protein